MSPDALVRWYDQAVDSLAPSLDLVRAEGRVYAKVCGTKLPAPKRSRKARLAGLAAPRDRHCASAARVWSYAERQWVCGRCGAPWRFWNRRSLKGEVQESVVRADGTERRLQRLVDVGLALRRLGDGWPARLYLAWARGVTIRRLAELGAAGQLGAGAPFAWGKSVVGRQVQAGSAAWRAILTDAGFRVEG